MDRTVQLVTDPLLCGLRGAALAAGLALGDITPAEVRSLVPVDRTFRPDAARPDGSTTSCSPSSLVSTGRSGRCSAGSTRAGPDLPGLPELPTATRFAAYRLAMTIRLNGAEYDSWEDVPEEMRRMLDGALPDLDGNGVPDAFEGKAEPGHHTYKKIVVTRPRDLRPGEEHDPGKLRMKKLSVTTDGDDPDPASDISPLYRPRWRPADPGAAVPAPEDAPVSSASTVPQGMIELNGELVNVDGTPPKRHWWRRG